MAARLSKAAEAPRRLTGPQMPAVVEVREQSHGVVRTCIEACACGCQANAGTKGQTAPFCRKALLERRLLRTWLRPRMDRRSASQAALGRALCVPAPQIAGWLNGTESIPQYHLLSLGKILRLSDSELRELLYLAQTTRHLNALDRIFIPEMRRGKQSTVAQIDLAGYFRNPVQILDRLLGFIAAQIQRDRMILSGTSDARIVDMHIEAACRSCSDLNSYVSNDNVNLFNDRNIAHHLRYPHHHYVSFFLTETTAADGQCVEKLRTTIFVALEACVDLLQSRQASDVRAAQHAMHMLTRYRGDPIATFRVSPNPETRRMAYFGDIHRLFDDGPFEEVAQLILTDEALGMATASFDGTHYGDYLLDTDVTDPNVVPAQTIARLLASLADARASMRLLASARLRNLIRESGGRQAFHSEMQQQIAARLPTIEGFRPSNDLERKVHNQLLSATQTCIEEKTQ